MKKIIYFLMLVILSFSVIASENITIDFRSIPNFDGNVCVNTATPVVATPGAYDTSFPISNIISPPGASCIIPQNQSIYTFYGYMNCNRWTSNPGDVCKSYLNYELEVNSSAYEGLRIGDQIGLTNQGVFQPNIIIDLGATKQIDSNSIMQLQLSSTLNKCRQVHFTFIDENLTPVFSSLQYLNVDVTGAFAGSLPDIACENAGVHRGFLTYNEDNDIFSNGAVNSGGNVSFTMTSDDTYNFRYIQIGVTGGTWTPYYIQVHNFSITNVIDPCADLNAIINNSILSSIFQDYFNYSVPYFCNGWEGSSLKNNIADGSLDFNLTDTVDFMTHGLLTNYSTLTMEFDFNLNNLQGFGFGFVNQVGAGSSFLNSLVVSGNSLFINSIAKYNLLDTVDNFSVKVEHFATTNSMNVQLYRNDILVFNESQLPLISNAGANSVTFYGNRDNSLFEINNLIIYSGTEKDFDNSIIATNIQETQELQDDVGSDIEEGIELMGFITPKSKAVFFLLILLFFSIIMITTGNEMGASGNAIFMTVLIVDVLILILGYIYGFIPFWIIFLLALICFGGIALWLSGAGNNG